MHKLLHRRRRMDDLAHLRLLPSTQMTAGRHPFMSKTPASTISHTRKKEILIAQNHRMACAKDQCALWLESINLRRQVESCKLACAQGKRTQKEHTQTRFQKQPVSRKCHRGKGHSMISGSLGTSSHRRTSHSTLSRQTIQTIEVSLISA